MTIRVATEEDIPAIRKLAHDTWWPTYQSILSPEQISFMLDTMYSEPALKTQLQKETFLITKRDLEPVAFASFSCSDQEQHIFKLHKIYILPSEQGNGTGRKLISAVEQEAKKEKCRILELNVNRQNPAFHFYKKQGFKVHQEVDIPYYDYYMNDYIMRKSI
ncbi:N-acetyltransferase family protein [Arcticibacter tournemirensis]